MSSIPTIVENCPILELPNKWTIQGFSKSGIRTGFMLEPLHVLLDIGLTSYTNSKAVFLTHIHIDHTLSIPETFLITDFVNHDKTPKYLIFNI
jgi:ribonuclease BN (tRNA processing enzyme)